MVFVDLLHKLNNVLGAYANQDEMIKPLERALYESVPVDINTKFKVGGFEADRLVNTILVFFDLEIEKIKHYGFTDGQRKWGCVFDISELNQSIFVSKSAWKTCEVVWSLVDKNGRLTINSYDNEKHLITDIVSEQTIYFRDLPSLVSQLSYHFLNLVDDSHKTQLTMNEIIRKHKQGNDRSREELMREADENTKKMLKSIDDVLISNGFDEYMNAYIIELKEKLDGSRLIYNSIYRPNRRFDLFVNDVISKKMGSIVTDVLK